MAIECYSCKQKFERGQGGRTFQLKGEIIQPNIESREWVMITCNIMRKAPDGGEQTPLCTECFLGVMSRSITKAKETPALMSTKMDFLKF